MTYSLDFRKRVLDIKKSRNLSFNEAAKLFNIGRATLFRWNHELQPKLKRNKKPVKLDYEKLIDDVKQVPDAFQYERAKRLGVSPNTIGRALKKLGLTRKKRHSNILKHAKKKGVYIKR